MPGGIPCRVGYRAGWDTVPGGIPTRHATQAVLFDLLGDLSFELLAAILEHRHAIMASVYESVRLATERAMGDGHAHPAGPVRCAARATRRTQTCSAQHTCDATWRARRSLRRATWNVRHRRRWMRMRARRGLCAALDETDRRGKLAAGHGCPCPTGSATMAQHARDAYRRAGDAAAT